ncbi:carbohydrate porin [Ruegeria sediminis]|uniref:carbohydrate porin n=1 Tax=Ruegeria sediminis TaxID=2583820 RepID=UPI0014876125|nr:carbohydrate porin [Ruegeria sediminis]
MTIVFLTGPSGLHAETVGFEYGEMSGVFEPTSERDGYLSIGLIDRAYDSYADWKTGVQQRHGLSFLIENRLINQWGPEAELYDNELNLIARQEAFRFSPGTVSLNIWGQFANSLGGRTAGRFQNDLGILSPLNGGNSGPDTSNQILQMLVVEYVSPDERWRVQAGKLALRTLVNLNRYANGDSEMFFSPMLGNNPVVPYTALLGLGVFGEYRSDLWRVSALVRAPDTELGLSTDAWKEGKRGYVVEAALTPGIPGLGDGIYRLTWSLDEANDTLPRMETWSISADQDFGARFGGFARYARADTTFRDFRRRAALGFQIKKPFGFTYDRFGLGGWWGDPSNPALRDERGIEMFYNAQVTPYLQVTPDIQVVFDPANSNANSEVVLGLRLRLAL